MLYFSYLGGDGLYGMGSAPDVGWWAYAPLTAKVFSPGHSTDYWTLSILLGGIGTTGTAINIVATALCMRCKGMTLSRMPLLVWLYTVVSVMVFFTISPLTAAQIMLTIDRYPLEDAFLLPNSWRIDWLFCGCTSSWIFWPASRGLHPRDACLRFCE